MAGIKFSLGLIPNTKKVEEAENKLWQDFKDYQDFEGSDELRHFETLEKTVTSPEFASKKKEILGSKFKNTEEHKKEQEFKSLQKSAPIKNYFKVKDSAGLKAYEDFQKSDSLKRIDELEKFIKSDALAKAKSELSAKDFKASDEAKKETEYLRLQKSSAYKKYLKFKNSKAFNEYERIKGSEDLKKYEELKQFIESEDFTKVKEYMTLSPKKKFQLSDEYKKETEYNDLKDSDKIKWYYKTKKKYPFKEIENLELTFEEKFDAGQVDKKKWINRYLNGDKTINSPYVMADDKHGFADGKNLEIKGNALQIITKREEIKNLSWSPMFGFLDKEFAYSSDMISSGKSFRQKNGVFQAKIKMGKSQVTQAFSLQSDAMVPHIDIARFEKNKLSTGSFWNNGSGISKSISKTGGGRYTSNYYIYSLDWEPGKLTWKINGEVFKVQSGNIPENEMYLVFNASLKESAKDHGLPSAMEIDWVRVYRKK